MTQILAFLPLCDDLVPQLAALQVAEAERHLIAPTGAWMAQAALTPDARTFGVFAEQCAVGLLSLLDPRTRADFDHGLPDHLYIWRVMVDEKARSLGHGAAIVTFAKNYAQLVGLNGVSLTTMDQKPHNALGFYHKQGFKPTGRRLDGEAELVWRA